MSDRWGEIGLAVAFVGLTGRDLTVAVAGALTESCLERLPGLREPTSGGDLGLPVMRREVRRGERLFLGIEER